ncbi:MAG: metallophosphoesterase [Polyangiaceae bacterium]
MTAFEYIETGLEDECVDDLVAGKSKVIIGERRSGLSTLATKLLVRVQTRLQQANQPHAIVHVEARVLSPGDAWFRDLAGAIARSLFEQPRPIWIAEMLTRLSRESSKGDLIDFLEATASKRGRIIVCIDYFEHLVSMLPKDGWSFLRWLIENHRLQVLLLSRLGIDEIESLTDSKLAATVTQLPVLQPFKETAKRVRLIPPDVRGALGEDSPLLREVADLAAGYRGLTSTFTQRIAARSGPLDARIGDDRVEIERALVNVLRPLAPEGENDPKLRETLEKERRALHDVFFAPASYVPLLDAHVDRLLKLGHLQKDDVTGNLRFGSPLFHSLARIRCIEDRRRGRFGTLEYEGWLAHDDLLRGLLRGHLAETLEATVDGAEPAAAMSFARARAWWGDRAGQDALDHLHADALYGLASKTGALTAAWVEGNRDDIALLTSARRTSMTSDCKRLVGARRAEAEAALGRLGDALSPLKPAPKKGPAVSEPSGRRVLRWLHVSDAHFRAGVGFEERLILKTLLSQLGRQRELPMESRLGPPPDLVFFTGDLAFSGKKAEYDRAKPFLVELLTVLGLDRDRLFIVPGNHDVDRTETTFLERTPTGEEVAHKAFKDARWRRLYGERFAEYKAFCRDFFGDDSRAPDAGFGSVEVLVRGVSASVRLLNAQWCGGLNDDRDKLIVGLTSLQEELLETPPSKVSMRLALIHQSVDYLREFERNRFVQVLGPHTDVLLRGHLHRQDVTKTITTRSELLEIATGALLDDEVRDSTANFVEVDVDTRELTVFPVMFTRERDEWVRDPRLGGDFPRYQVTRTLRRVR